MKSYFIKLTILIISAIFLISTCIISHAANDKALCYSCHPELEVEFEKISIHKPIIDGKCIDCHNPHASSNRYFLTATGGELCLICHLNQQQDFLKLKYQHKPIEDGECLKCHDAHAADYSPVLSNMGQDLCFPCHEKNMFTDEYTHIPAESGECLKCHKPHSSNEARLLQTSTKILCQDCHKFSANKLKTTHYNYPVKQSDCVSCHDPHSSQNKALISNITHNPFMEGERCTTCHNGPMKKNPLALKTEEKKLCLSCHKNITKEFEKKYSHLTNDIKICTSCHKPHASRWEGLIPTYKKAFCIKCHDKVGKRIKNKSLKHHPKVSEGKCNACHEPHASNDPKFLRSDQITLCTDCHERQKRLTHPVGSETKDPRDNKKIITCITCHNPMGTEYKYNLRLDGSGDLCRQCHKR